MKKNLFIVCIILILTTIVCTAHSGRLDANGGHYNRSTGEYHYHRYKGTEPASDSIARSKSASSISRKKTEDIKTDSFQSNKTTLIAALLTFLLAFCIFFFPKQTLYVLAFILAFAIIFLVPCLLFR